MQNTYHLKKSIRIGRSSSNDIVISEQTVSSHHAVLTEDASAIEKSYRIKDLNSTNGTFVNGKRISEEVTIQPGDTLKLGNYVTSIATLLASQKKEATSGYIPAPAEIMDKKTIGRTPNNDFALPYQDVSSNHAILIKKTNGEIVIVDKNSTNGTYVNGKRVPFSTLRPGDRIQIANKYALNWEGVFSSNKAKAPLGKLTGIAAVLAAAVTVVLVFLLWAPWKPWAPGKKGNPEEIYAYYNKSVALICHTYFFEVKAAGEMIGQFVFYKDDNGTEDIAPVDKLGPMAGFGTGFFVTADGKIMTNRHVINMSMGEKEHLDALKKYFQLYFEQYASALQSRRPREAARYRNASNNIEVSVKTYSIGIAPNDTYVTSYSDFMPCTILGDTGSEEIDLGLIQINTKSLPSGVEHFVNLDMIDTDIIEGRNLYTIGFPRALTIGSTAQGVEAQKQSGHISQVRGNVQFGHNLNIDHGSSGSPIFSDKGKLIGVVNAGFLGASGNFNIGIQAPHAVELLNKYK